jgi:hypothetical protein
MIPAIVIPIGGLIAAFLATPSSGGPEAGLSVALGLVVWIIVSLVSWLIYFMVF